MTEENKPKNETKKKAPTYLYSIIDTYLQPILESNGWTVIPEEKISQGKSRTTKFYLPPNVYKRAPFVRRKDYYDSKLSLIEHIKALKVDFVNVEIKNVGYVKEFLICCDLLDFGKKCSDEVIINNVEELMKSRGSTDNGNDSTSLIAASSNENLNNHNSTTTKTATTAPISSIVNNVQKPVIEKHDPPNITYQKILPRYLGQSSEHPLFPPQKIKSLFETNIFVQNNITNGQKDILQSNVEVKNDYTVLFTAKGRRNIIPIVKHNLHTYCKGFVFLYNLHHLYNNPHSIILKIKVQNIDCGNLFDVDEMNLTFGDDWKIGLPSYMEEKIGVWVDSDIKDFLLNNGGLGNALPNAVINLGVAVIEINERRITCIQDITNEMRKSDFMTVTLCVNKDCDLSQIYPSYVVSDDNILRVKNGDVCKTWRFDNEKGFVRIEGRKPANTTPELTTSNTVVETNQKSPDKQNTTSVINNKNTPTIETENKQPSVNAKATISVTNSNEIVKSNDTQISKQANSAKSTSVNTNSTTDEKQKANEIKTNDTTTASTTASKTKATPKTTNNTSIKPSNAPLSSTILTLPKKAIIPAKSKLISKPIAPQRNNKEFSILFEPFLPLGFYCITETINKNTLCKIISVNPKTVQTAKDVSRIQPGTIVCASSLIVGTVLIKKINVSSHAALQTQYINARKRGNNCKLRLYFINENTEKKGCDNDWNESGHWQGVNGDLGWAGGASLSKRDLSLNSSRELQSNENSPNELLGQAFNNNVNHVDSNANKSSQNITEIKNDEQNIESNGNTSTQTNNQQNHKQSQQDKVEETLKNARQALSSSSQNKFQVSKKLKIDIAFNNKAQSLKTNAISSTIEEENNLPQLKPSSKRRVSFCKQIDTRMYYDPMKIIEEKNVSKTNLSNPNAQNARLSSPTNNHINSSTTTSSNNTVHETTEVELLSYAVREHDFKQVIQVLKSGKVDPQEKDIHGKTAMEYIDQLSDQLKQELKELQGNTTEQDALIFQLKDFSYKKKLMKIFINAAYLINNSRFIEDWIFADIAIKQIDSICLSNKAKEFNLPPYAFCTVSSNGQKLGDTAVVDFTANNRLFWNDGILTSFITKYNAAPANDFTYKKFSLDVNLIMGSPIKGMCLGSVSIPLETVKEWLEQVSKTKPGPGIENIRIIEIPKSQYLDRSASLQLIIRKLPPDNDFLARKTDEFKKKITELINWVQEFKKETAHLFHSHDNSHDVKLDYNLSTPKSDGVNLLQAAVHLGDARLVSQLLELGADPYLASVEGTTIELAAHLADTFKNNIQCDHLKHGYVSVNDMLMQYAASNPKENGHNEDVASEQSDQNEAHSDNNYAKSMKELCNITNHYTNNLTPEQNDPKKEVSIILPPIASLEKMSSPTKRKAETIDQWEKKSKIRILSSQNIL